MITVSVCMITFNHEKYIHEAIQGVLNQKTSFNVEFVISNDASTDKTNAIINEFLGVAHKNVSFTYFNHKENLGMMPNFIFALKQCKGKYIALCEGDDYWTDSSKLQKQIDFLESNIEFAGCFHNVFVTNEMLPDFKSKPWRSYTKDVFTLKDTFSKTALFHTSSIVFRRDCLAFPEWFKDVKSGDMALFALVASKGNLKLLDGNMGVYRKNENGVTSNLKLIDYHKSRMRLMTFFMSEFKVHIKHLKSIKKYHGSEILNIGKNKIKRVLKRRLN
ncbi:glycosyltransferase family 2 protein [Flavivirga eckloniae]|uniref:Glycosyltransferase 2-like domain-containing protein n=1 Tax=Flavivirga eckloniae TaxID=1803846 RepID=A0A2K9PM82_9FLAO|nr:glycosyltransferase [Flavivirga eckloniae]AUP78179.1 hypothetical protein C1H87_05395 [Flavivirga eckloniae]